MKNIQDSCSSNALAPLWPGMDFLQRLHLAEYCQPVSRHTSVELPHQGASISRNVARFPLQPAFSARSSNPAGERQASRSIPDPIRDAHLVNLQFCRPWGHVGGRYGANALIHEFLQPLTRVGFRRVDLV
jgi:hypothetical protein